MHLDDIFLELTDKSVRTMNSNICSYKRNAKEKHYESECNMYTHPILHVVKVILLTCKLAWQVAAGNVSGNVDDTATGKCLHMFGIQNIHDQFVLESHLLCLHGEQK